MRRFVIFVSCCLISASCSKVEMTSNENTQRESSKAVKVSQTVRNKAMLKPIVPNVRLNSKQKKYLNESLPPQVRKVLEKAEKFEILAEVDNEPDGLKFDPNRVAYVSDESDKKEILESFYYDASDGFYASACYIPHHGLRAEYQGKTVEIEICFQCHLFYVKSSFGEFEGGIVRENQRSEEVFNRIIQDQSVELKK